MHYIAIIHKDEHSDFGVCFPDLPGCISAGKTLEEARLMAVEALETHVSYMIEEGLTVPEPSSLDAVIKHEDYEGAAAVLLVPLEIEQKVQRVNISVPERDLVRIDRYASSHSINRSTFLVQSALQAIQAADPLKVQKPTVPSVVEFKLATTTEKPASWNADADTPVAGAIQ